MKGFMGKPYDSTPAEIIRNSHNERDAEVQLCKTFIYSNEPVNLLAGSDKITIFFLKAILRNEGLIKMPREYFVDCEEACCKECVQTGKCGQARPSAWSIVRWNWNQLTEGGWCDPGGEICCPESHDSEFKRVASQLTPELMQEIKYITITPGSRGNLDLPTFCSALQNIRRYIPKPQTITIEYRAELPLDPDPAAENRSHSPDGSVFSTAGSLIYSVASASSPLGAGALQAPNAIHPLPEPGPSAWERFWQRRRRKKEEWIGVMEKQRESQIERLSRGFSVLDGVEIHREERSGQGVSTNDFVVLPFQEPFTEKTPHSISEKEESRDRMSIMKTIYCWFALCFLVIIAWPMKQRNKFLNRMREQRMGWKAKLMVWRLEDCLPAKKRIKHVGDWDSGTYMWQNGGRKWWQ